MLSYRSYLDMYTLYCTVLYCTAALPCYPSRQNANQFPFLSSVPWMADQMRLVHLSVARPGICPYSSIALRLPQTASALQRRSYGDIYPLAYHQIGNKIAHPSNICFPPPSNTSFFFQPALCAWPFATGQGPPASLRRTGIKGITISTRYHPSLPSSGPRCLFPSARICQNEVIATEPMAHSSSFMALLCHNPIPGHAGFPSAEHRAELHKRVSQFHQLAVECE